jgi:hypothetical protein
MPKNFQMLLKIIFKNTICLTAYNTYVCVYLFFFFFFINFINCLLSLKDLLIQKNLYKIEATTDELLQEELRSSKFYL